MKPGAPEQSELLKRILSKDPDEVMPPPDSHKKITPEHVATLRRRISEGAVYRKHWGFELPVKTPVPAASSGTSPIDAFLRAELAKRGLSPNAEASNEQLIRRVTLDLTGLPPAPVEIDAFLADTASDAYKRLVDRMLGSIRHAERVARYWLDAARCGDTHGMHLDNDSSRWPYRDW